MFSFLIPLLNEPVFQTVSEYRVQSVEVTVPPRWAWREISRYYSEGEKKLYKNHLVYTCVSIFFKSNAAKSVV